MGSVSDAYLERFSLATDDATDMCDAHGLNAVEVEVEEEELVVGGAWPRGWCD